MSYIYETHLHTSLGSLCSRVSPEDQIRRLHHYGYTGAFVTEHFFNGNTAIPKDLPWEEAIDRFMLSYDLAKAEGDRLGLDVFFGFECSYNGNDVLTYGLGREWLKSHPEMMEMSMRQYCEFARAEGGFVVHAHPFREAGYIDLIRLLPRSVDAVEILNANRSDFQNDRAEEYARNYELPVTAGSDLHIPQCRLAGVSSPVRFASEMDYCNAVRQGQVSPIVVFDGRETNTLCD
ncbi:MAG: PHP domain-containing protein [Clostridia bacterium]|nr:PHP domain-containing protein [Clostridia bacterium]